MGVHEALALMVDFGSLVVALLTLAVAITVALNQKK
ncbi:putative holin-like toxin [Insulibacter thermoxylanivorax]|nr:putative holin-like toxin [Insulibacter thermoxylanivorax]